MATQFVITRTGGRRLMIARGDFRAEYVEDRPNGIKECLRCLDVDPGDAALLARLGEAVDRFYQLEARALAKFGPPRLFRIWRVDPKTIQVDFKGGHAELGPRARGDAALKRCLVEMGANLFLLNDLKRELADFLRDEGAAD